MGKEKHLNMIRAIHKQREGGGREKRGGEGGRERGRERILQKTKQNKPKPAGSVTLISCLGLFGLELRKPSEEQTEMCGLLSHRPVSH